MKKTKSHNLVTLGANMAIVPMLGDSAQLDKTIQQSQDVFKRLGDTFLNARSLMVLILALIVAVLIGRIVGFFARRAAKAVARQADKTKNLQRVNRLRWIETMIILTTAVVRALLVALAFYFWWGFIYPNNHPTAIIGAGAIFAIFAGGALSPLLRDIAAGGAMMAEQWYGVGDHVKIEPFVDIHGVVERVTLRSTRIRGLNGDVIWINNQSIGAVRVTPRGSTTIALELFVSDIELGLRLIEQANLRLPSSPLMVVSPLTVMTSTEVGKRTWQVTAIGETAPGREWLLEKYAVDLINEIDSEENDKAILLNTPIARYADTEAERKFARTIYNARKQPVKRLRRVHNSKKKATSNKP